MSQQQDKQLGKISSLSFLRKTLASKQKQEENIQKNISQKVVYNFTTFF